MDAEYYFDPYYDTQEDIGVTCKYCGAEGLEWVQLPQGWRLADCDGNLHHCHQKDDPADAFA